MSKEIQTAENTAAKHDTYTSLLSRHKKAIQYQFFFEALLIDYAMLEDRLNAFLWAAGVINDFNQPKFGVKKNKAQLRRIYHTYLGEEKQPNFRNISCKIEMTLALIHFGKTSYDEDDRYLSELHKALQDLDLTKLEEALLVLDEWREYRNAVIHGAMSKNIYSLYENLEEYAVNGLSYARTIDNESKKLKRRQNVRKSVKLPLTK